MERAMEFDGKTVLVTGGTSGIGRATALAFAERGARVVVVGRDEARGQGVVAEIGRLDRPGPAARFVRADLTSHADVQRLVQDAGPVDVLVNNAGYWELGPTSETREAGFDQMFAVNVKAPFFLTAAYAPQMAARGGGAIVNVSTMVASRGLAGMAAYGASKAALELLTRSWAAEYGPQGVRVNAVALGPTLTPATEPMAGMLPAMVAMIPLRRAADPGEVANAIVYLASAASSYITGAVLAVDGGRAAAL
ncbi:short-chain dehydrogenase [Gemmatimonadetes bacterium T265]|nr:short-chain dehydrogenase [Gemmatimonadetes bacterium T265]